MLHVWHLYAMMLEEARIAIARCGDALRLALAQ